MKKFLLVIMTICVLAVSALAVNESDYWIGGVFDEHGYNAAVALEKVDAAGLDLFVGDFWEYDADGKVFFNNEAFEEAYAAALAAAEPDVIEEEEPADDLDSSDPEYLVGAYVDEAGNVFSPDGELLSPGTTPAVSPDSEAQTEDNLLVDEGLDGAEVDETFAPAVYTVSDLRSGDDTSLDLAEGLKGVVISIFGEYDPVTTTAAVTETVDNVTTTTLIDVVASGAAGVDFEWIAGVVLFGILLFCMMKLLGGILK